MQSFNEISNIHGFQQHYAFDIASGLWHSKFTPVFIFYFLFKLNIFFYPSLFLIAHLMRSCVLLLADISATATLTGVLNEFVLFLCLTVCLSACVFVYEKFVCEHIGALPLSVDDYSQGVLLLSANFYFFSTATSTAAALSSSGIVRGHSICF